MATLTGRGGTEEASASAETAEAALAATRLRAAAAAAALRDRLEAPIIFRFFNQPREGARLLEHEGPRAGRRAEIDDDE